MGKLAMCRMCLVEDVSMYEVASLNLQKMYDKLTDIPFVTEDCRPMLACFFCYTKLKQCCLFQRKCLKAEEVFAQMLNGDYEQIPLEFQGEIEYYGGFTITPLQCMSIDDVCQTERDPLSEEQLPAVCDTEDDIELKEEYLSDELEAEYVEDSQVDQEDIPSHHSESDSEDDVPLVKFKTEAEEEQEVPEESTRAPVAKIPKLDIRKAKLEDTITDKQKKNGLSASKIIHTTRTKSVTKFGLLGDTIIKPDVDNSILDKTIIIESLKIENDTEVINTYQKHLKSHFRTYTREKPYKCDLCQCSFTRKQCLKSHDCIYTEEKPIKCKICPDIFKSQGNLNTHNRIHTGEKPYTCEICHRTFNKPGYLNKHSRIHAGDKLIKCKSYLNKHIREHTDEKPYECKICQRNFNDQSHLNRHIRIHTGEKPYKCEICWRGFNGHGNLNRHIRTHTGEKPYKCKICQRNFNDQGHLNRHNRIHTGEKPYKCEICQRSFTQKDNMKIHIRTHQ